MVDDKITLNMRDRSCIKHLEAIVIHHELDVEIFVICQVIQIISNDVFFILLTENNNISHHILIHIYTLITGD